MKIKTAKTLTACLLLGNMELVHAGAPPRPRVQLDYTATRSAGLEQAPGNTEFKIKEMHVMVKFARQDSALGNIIYGVDYKQHRISLLSNGNLPTLHQLSLPITLIHKRSQWTVVAQLAPAINSDFESLGQDDFTARALLRAAYHRSDTTDWTMGVVVDRSFGDSQLIPVLGMNYTPDPRWQLQLVLPRPAIRYYPNANTVLYWQAQPAGNKWNVEPAASDQAFNVTTKVIRSGIGLEIAARQAWWFRAELGREFNRELETVSDNGTALDLQVQDAAYLSMSFLYRI